jgi:signal transduction histidine kinase
MLKQPTLKAYLLETLKPFKFLLHNKNLALKIEDNTHKNLSARNPIPQNKINAFICTDFKIYEEILFHLMANACKFSPENSKIEI